MGFRRYGGDIETKNLGGGARLTGFAFNFAALGGFAAYQIGSLILFVVVIIIPLLLLLAANPIGQIIESPVRRRRQNYHIKRFAIAYKKRDFANALESLRRAEIYGVLPEEIVSRAMDCRARYEIKT